MKSRRKHFNGHFTQWCPDYLIQRWKLFPTNFASKTWDDAQPTRRLIAWAGAALGFVALLLGSFGSGDPIDSENPISVAYGGTGLLSFGSVIPLPYLCASCIGGRAL